MRISFELVDINFVGTIIAIIAVVVVNKGSVKQKVFLNFHGILLGTWIDGKVLSQIVKEVSKKDLGIVFKKIEKIVLWRTVVGRMNPSTKVEEAVMCLGMWKNILLNPYRIVLRLGIVLSLMFRISPLSVLYLDTVVIDVSVDLSRVLLDGVGILERNGKLRTP